MEVHTERGYAEIQIYSNKPNIRILICHSWKTGRKWGPPPTPVALFPLIPLPYFFQLNLTYETDFTLCPRQIYHF